MALKHPGMIDSCKGRLTYFVCYCPYCKQKFTLARDEMDVIRKNIQCRFGINTYPQPYRISPRQAIKATTKKVLTNIVEKL